MDLPTTRNDNATGSPVIENKKTGTSTNFIKKINLESVSFYVFLSTIFLVPIAFFPSPYAPLDLVKIVVLSVCILISTIVYVATCLKNKSIVIPRPDVAYASLFFLVGIIISSFLSTHVLKSFIGQGFEATTTSFIFLMCIAAFLTTRFVIKDATVIFKIYTAILSSFIVIVLFHMFRLIGGADFLSLGFLQGLTSTILGKWYDIAIFAGITGLLAYLSIKFLVLSKGIKKILVTLLLVSIATLVIVNFKLVWIALALIFLSLGIYEYSIKSSKTSGIKGVFSRVPIITLVLCIISILGAWNVNLIAAPLSKYLKIEHSEIILPWQLTLDITADTLKESPFFGAGPNRFGYQYLRYKPVDINQTPFWNSEFTSGFGVLPTLVTNLGIVGFVLLTIFSVFFVRGGIRMLKKASDPLAIFFATSSFFIASFLWLMNMIYIPSHALIFLTFVFTGICIAIPLRNQEGSVKKWEYKKIVPIATTIALILLVVWMGVYAKKITAVSYFQKGIRELNLTSSVSSAQKNFEKALAWDKSDVYYQALSEINILKINSLTQEIQTENAKNPEAPLDQKKIDQIMNLINQSVNYTKSAEKMDPLNHYNYIAEARISEIASSFKIPNAYESTKNAYANALKTNPYNPSTYLNLARLEVTQNKLTDARQYVGRALQMKQNYTEAVYLLSQIQVANGQLKDAITSVRIATEITPTEPTLFFQLGILEYNDKNYGGAVVSLEKALKLNGQYANAKYFLGLSYARVGRNAEAITQFEDLVKSNPDNVEVSFILNNLKEGKSPFSDVKPPIDNKPEKRKVLPVIEKTKGKDTK